jgi:hypothetical protein
VGCGEGEEEENSLAKIAKVAKQSQKRLYLQNL